MVSSNKRKRNGKKNPPGKVAIPALLPKICRAGGGERGLCRIYDISGGKVKTIFQGVFCMAALSQLLLFLRK